MADGTLMIVRGPSYTIQYGNYTPIGLGDTTSQLLRCVAGHQGDGVMNYSPPTVVWVKNGQPVDDTDSRITVTSGTLANGQLTTILTITSFTLSDAGVYQCVFIDSGGSDPELITTIPLRLDTGNIIILY